MTGGVFGYMRAGRRHSAEIQVEADRIMDRFWRRAQT